MSEHQINLAHRRCGSFPAPTLRQLWTGLPLFLLLLKGFLFPLPLLDFWWHLRMGQVIVDTWSIPRVDSFSFTAAGKIYVAQNWLAEVLFYLVYKTGGFPLLVFVNAALLACMLVPILGLCRKASNSFGAGIFAACLVSLCMPCNMRPQVFSYGIFAIYYWVLTSYCCGKRNWIWLLPFLMVLWVNLHGAFVLGMALMAIILCCECVRSIPKTSPPCVLSRRQLAKLALIFILCAIATLANPEKLGVYNYIHTVINDPSSRQLVMEWQPPAIHSIQGIVQFYLPFFLTILILMVSDRRPGLVEMALCAGFSFFGLTATRNAAWFLLVSAPILARHLPFHNWASAPSQGFRELQPNLTPLQPYAPGKKEHYRLNFAVGCLALIIVGIQSPWVQQRFYGKSLLDPNTPVGAMDYIETHSLTGNIFHPQAYGDYLIWRLWPKQRSFFDGRVHLFGMPFVREYQKIYNDSHGEELLGKYHIRFLLLSKGEEKPEGRRMIERVRGSGGWKLLYEDNISILFEEVSHVDR